MIKFHCLSAINSRDTCFGTYGNMCFVIVCYPVCDFMKFEILIFIKCFSYMTIKVSKNV